MVKVEVNYMYHYLKTVVFTFYLEIDELHQVLKRGGCWEYQDDIRLQKQLEKNGDHTTLTSDFNRLAMTITDKDDSIQRTKTELAAEKRKSTHQIQDLSEEVQQKRSELIAERQESHRELTEVNEEKRISEIDSQQQLRDIKFLHRKLQNIFNSFDSSVNPTSCAYKL
jgi:chromosome segregation ATPase